MISLTDDQRAAVDYVGNLMLNACPGSGKTRVIIAKLLTLAETVIETPRSIACITYTNTAVEEIEQRIRQFGSDQLLKKTEISTIHSFCLQHILRPYKWLAPDVPTGFRILTREMREFDRFVRAVEDEIGRQISRRAFEDYGSIAMDADGNPVGTGIESGMVTDALARRYWELCRRSGYIDFSMILYYSLQILLENPFVSLGIASRFKWFLVDEFQDTTHIQIKIFSEFQAQGLTEFFLVGDNNQSIFRFAGAKPHLAEEFSNRIGAHTEITLSGNFRSDPRIVDLAEQLIGRAPPMHSEGKSRTYLHEPEYIHVERPVIAITDHFLPLLEENGILLGNAAVLAPWWTHLIPIARTLRGLDVPVFGPGARPYQRSRLFAVLAEQLGACVNADDLLGLPGIEKAIFRLIGQALGISRFDIFTYAGRRTSLALVYEAKRLAHIHPGGMDWLKAISQSASDILIENEWLPESARDLFHQSVAEMKNDMELRGVDVENLQISDLGLFANPDKALKLITLHNAKGREFDAVALICMNEGNIPHYLDRSVEEFDEARRLLYVGITRPRKILMLASDQSHWRNRPTRYLRECGLPA